MPVGAVVEHPDVALGGLDVAVALTVRSLVTLAGALGVKVVELFAEPKSRVVRPGRPAKG